MSFLKGIKNYFEKRRLIKFYKDDLIYFRNIEKMASNTAWFRDLKTFTSEYIEGIRSYELLKDVIDKYFHFVKDYWQGELVPMIKAKEENDIEFNRNKKILEIVNDSDFERRYIASHKFCYDTIPIMKNMEKILINMLLSAKKENKEKVAELEKLFLKEVDKFERLAKLLGLFDPKVGEEWKRKNHVE